MGAVYPTRRFALIPTAPFRNEKSFSAQPAHWLVNKQTPIGMDRGMNLQITLRCSGSANAVEKFAGP